MKLILQKAANRIVVLVALFLSYINVSGQVTLPHYEDMNYAAAASLQTQTNWTVLNTGDNLLITSGSLNYPGLPSSTGNKVAFDASGIDAAKAFTSQTTGTVYYSFLMNVTSLGTLGATGGYFTSFTDLTTAFGATVWTRADGAGYDIGLNPRTTAANTVWTTGTTSLNTTVLVVVSCQIVAGATNDIVKLWINPTLGSTEALATLTLSATNTLADLANLSRILIRQDNGTNTPFVEMDELRIGTSWESVTPSSVAGGTISTAGTIPLVPLSTIYGTASTTTDFSVSGTSLTTGITITPPLGFEVSETSNFSTTIGTNASPLTIGTAPTVPSTTIFVRLAANASAGNKTGNIVLSSAGSLPVNVATSATNTVSLKDLNITGLTADDKTFDNTTTATLSGTAILAGIVSGDEPDVILGGTYIANFDTSAIGTNKPVTVTGYTITGSKAANYNLLQPAGLTADINPSSLLPQTITFGALTPVTYGVLPITLGATTTSPLTVTYTLSPPTGIATIAGNVITIVGVGTLTITASQAGDLTYLPATDVVQNLIVNQKDVTILAPSVSNKLYDGNTIATLSGTLDGVVSPDVVTLNLSANFADANVGSNKPVTSTSTITGADVSKYNLIQPTGLTASILFGPCGGTQGIVTWDFATASPTSNASSVTVSPLSQGNNNGTTTLINATSASNVYVGASGTNNAGAAARIGALDTTPTTGSAYFEFTLTPSAGSSVSLTGISFGSRRTSTGPQAYSLRSDLDGYTSDVATGSFTAASTWVLHTPSVVSSTNVNPTITFRLYGHSGVGSPAAGTANWRIDDLNLNLTENVITPLTSPTSVSTCSGDSFSYTPTTSLPSTTITWTRAAVAGISNPAVTVPQATIPAEVLVNTTNAPVNVIYEFTVSNSNCFYTQNVTVTVNNCASVVNLTMFVEGYYTGSGTMASVKLNQWDGVTPPLAPASDEVEDITVELHDAVTYALVTSTTAVLKTDGTAVCTFATAPNGSFYIAVKTSNAIQTWSDSPQTVGASPLSYNFTTAATQAYSSNMIETIDSGVWAFYSGDLNQDEVVDGSDAPNLTNDIENSAFGVQVTDINGDGAVDGSDAPFFENNSAASIFASYPF